MERLVVFVQRGDYELLHQALAAASAATALGRNVEVYFFWQGLSRLVKGPLEPEGELFDDLEARGVPTAKELLEAVRATGQCRLFACSGSLAALGLKPADVEGSVDELIGWTSILQRTRGVVDRLFF